MTSHGLYSIITFKIKTLHQNNRMRVRSPQQLFEINNKNKNQYKEQTVRETLEKN